ncbi:MAG: hypothetical protein D6763_11545 [Alphaproteobacteria bacterium]|nr:MAG: hypothetical protein D6763_11545 [Alphaproteobacteria bacterium]
MRELAARRKFEKVRMGRSEERARRVLFQLGVLALVGTLFISFLPFEFRAIGLDAALDRFLKAPGVDPLRWYNDQWTGHAIAYGTVSFLLAAGLMRGGAAGWIAGGVVTLVICLTAIFAAEIGQAFVIGRGVTGNDVAAGVVGVLSGLALWALFGPQLLSLAIRTRAGGDDALVAGATLYTIAYAVFLLFPFDFALSASAVSELVAEGKRMLALDTGDAGVVRVLARALFEVAAAAPVGFLVARWRGPGAVVRVVIFAVAVGLGAEVVQFFVKTGQSTLLAAVTRSVGVLVGWWLIAVLRQLAQRGVVNETRARFAIKLLTLIALPFYGLLLIALDGWQKGSPIGFGQAVERLLEINWLPFYYHYQGDEVSTLVSALSTVALYLPAGIAVWVLRGIAVRRPVAGTAALAAVCLSAGVEFGGLLFAGLRPDPTNLWLAGMGGALGGAGGAAVWRWLMNVVINTPQGEPVASTPTAPEKPGWRHLVALLIGLAALAVVVGFPTANGWILAGLLAYAALLWRHPSAWLVVVPAALPVLDFSVLTGRDFLDTFDTLLMVTVAVLLVRRPPRKWDVKMTGAAPWLIGAFSLAYLVSVAMGLFPLPPLDANFWTSPWATPQTLKVAKGLVWALLLYPFLARFLKNDPRGLLLFAYGMVAGLALTVGVVLWERFLFTGLFNVGSTGYRVIGAFTTMRTGGAHIDGYLVTALPFLAVMVMASGRWSARLVAAMLLLGGLYAVFATFSRGPYLATLAAAAVLGLGVWVASRQRAGGAVRFLALGSVGLGLLGAAAIPFLSESFLAKRFERLAQDSDIRVAHWREALSMMDDDLPGILFGMGPGRFPAIYRERNTDPVPMAYFRLGREGEDSFLSLFAGRSLYLSQFVRVRPHTRYTLRFQARTWDDRAKLTVPICEKWVTDSFDCAWVTIGLGNTRGEWVSFEKVIDTGTVGAPKGRSGWIGTRPVKFTLYYPTRSTRLDITDIRLLDPEGHNRLDNGDFSRGLDFWYFTVDDHLPWHVKNLFVAVWFDLGLVGLVLFVALLGVVILRLLAQVLAGERYSAVLLSSLSGFLVVGIVGSLFDAPRLTLLFFLIVFTALLTGELASRSQSGRGRRDDSRAAQDST